MSDNRGFFTVSMGLLGAMLHLPDGHAVVAIRPSEEGGDTFDVKIDGPLCPPILPGETTQRVSYWVTKTATGRQVEEYDLVGNITKVDESRYVYEPPA